MASPTLVLSGVSERSLVFLDSEKSALFVPFLIGPHTVAGAARSCGVGRKRMAYWVQRFLDLELVVRLEDDGTHEGRAPRYQAVSTAVEVRDLDVFLIEEHIDQQFEPLWRAFKGGLKRLTRQESPAWDLHVGLDARSTVVRRFVPTGMAVDDLMRAEVKEVNSWAMLPLRRRDVAALRAELDTLMEKYVRLAQEPHDEEVSTMLVHLGLVPAEE